MQPLRLLALLASTSPFGEPNSFRLLLRKIHLPQGGRLICELVKRTQKAPPLAGELSVNDSEQTEGEYLTALGFFEPFPFRHFVPLSPQAGTAFV